MSAMGWKSDLTKTVNYGEVHRSARGIVEGAPVRLTETVAERIASGSLDQHPEVEAVKVRVGNPHLYGWTAPYSTALPSRSCVAGKPDRRVS